VGRRQWCRSGGVCPDLGFSSPTKDGQGRQFQAVWLDHTEGWGGSESSGCAHAFVDLVPRRPEPAAAPTRTLAEPLGPGVPVRRFHPNRCIGVHDAVPRRGGPGAQGVCEEEREGEARKKRVFSPPPLILMTLASVLLPPHFQREALRVLVLLCEDPKCTAKVAAADAVPAMVDLLAQGTEPEMLFQVRVLVWMQ
jgi:hypothetical protein